MFNRIHTPGVKQGAVWLPCLLLLAVLLAGCGKKPGYVDPPPGISPTEFPRVYPDPATDPAP